MSSSALDWDVHFPLVHQTVSLPTAVSPTFQGSLKHDSGEALVARDMSEAREFPSLDSADRRQRRFLRVRMEAGWKANN